LTPHGHSRPKPPLTAEAPPTPEVDFDATHLGSPTVLDKNWRVGVTANPHAADPNFDDSSWSLRDAKPSIADVPDEDHPADAGPPELAPDQEPKGPPPGHSRPFAWFRIHIKLAPNHGPVALLVELPITPNAYPGTGSGSAIDIFVNGRHVDPEGPHGKEADHYQAISRIYDLGVPASETSVVLVARTMYVPFGFSAYTSFFSNRTFRIGSPDDLNRLLELWSLHTLFEHLPHLINEILLVILALFLFALYFTQRGHREYLWLAFYELVQAPLGFITLAGSTALLDQLWYAALLVELLMISAYLYFEFIVSFLALRQRWYIKWLRYSAPILALVGPSLLMVVLAGHNKGMALGFSMIILVCFFWLIGWMAFVLITLIAATIRRNFEAGLLLVPLLLTLVGVMEPIMTSGMTDWAGKPYRSPLTIQAGPIPIHFAAVADFTGLLAIVLIIFFRFLRIHRDRERASSELAAARSVQELMIPREKADTPGFEVDSVYKPANEVGGDFFHIESTADGGLLVVIGDVAGKGLKAAMNVSMLMGALRRTPEKHPARALESLNRVLSGSESFTTCQAAWFGPNGELVIANAGHLPPYLNSQEVSLPGGLPLGVLPEVTYEEVRLYLHPGDRILLMSDGVVEARQSSGELFGFGRVHNLSNQSAFYIADAAREFGQEDDITVLTVRRLAQAMAA
jgi:hypothetical protein